MNYLTYPCKVMRITQNYTGWTSHRPHTTGIPKDYPIDQGCTDGGRDWMYCPCDEMKIVRIYGVYGNGTNTVWLESTTKVDFADGDHDFFTLMVIHPNDDDLSRLKVGQRFTRGEAICREGKDGATGNHFHFSGGKGKMSGNGWKPNSKGKYVLTTTAGAYKPERLFFIDRKFTTVKNSKGIPFKSLPAENKNVSTGYKTGDYKVTGADLLNVRSGAGTQNKKKTFNQLTKSAQKKIKELNNGKKADGYVRGLTFTVLEVKGEWGRTPSGWVCLKYCTKI